MLLAATLTVCCVGRAHRCMMEPQCTGRPCHGGRGSRRAVIQNITNPCNQHKLHFIQNIILLNDRNTLLNHFMITESDSPMVFFCFFFCGSKLLRWFSLTMRLLQSREENAGSCTNSEQPVSFNMRNSLAAGEKHTKKNQKLRLSDIMHSYDLKEPNILIVYQNP